MSESWIPVGGPNRFGDKTRITLRDVFAALAPLPDDWAWAYISEREERRRTDDPRRQYTTPGRLALAAEYRYELADAMLAEREKGR